MTAEALSPTDLPELPAVMPDTPAAIRNALIDEERVEFEQAYHTAMAEASRNLDLTPVLDVLRNYRSIAVMTLYQGAAVHRRMLDTAAELMRTGKSPHAVPVEQMRALLDKRLGQ